MWSTGLESNHNRVKAATGKGLSSNEEDLGDINISFYSGEVLGRKEWMRSIYERKDNTTKDVLASTNASDIEYITNFPLKKSEKKPLEMTRGRKHLTRHFTDELLLENKPDESIRTVKIERTQSDPLGFYIRQGDGFMNKTGIFVSRILSGSLVENIGVLKTGDEILKVNHVDVRGLCLSDIVKLIQVPKLLILTVRLSSSQKHSRPKLSSRHSSPSLISAEEKDPKKSYKSKTKSKHSQTDSFYQMTANNEEKNKQRDDREYHMNTNKPSFDLSKNSSATEDLVLLLQAGKQDIGKVTYEHGSTRKLERSSTFTTEKENDKIDSVYAKPRPNFDRLVSVSSQQQINERSSKAVQKIASTLIPSTTVNLLFDDEETQTSSTTTNPYSQSVQLNKPQMNLTCDGAATAKSQSRHAKIDTLKVTSPEKSSRSRSSSRGSSPGGSPAVRRRLPSIPQEIEAAKKKHPVNESTSTKKHLLMPGNAEHKPHRKLPTPPASPVIGYKGQGRLSDSSVEQTVPRSPGVQKQQNKPDQNASSLSEAGSSKIETKAPDKPALGKTDNSNNNNKLDHVQNDNKDPKNEDGSKNETNDKAKTQEHLKTGARAVKPTPYRRSQSQYSDFFEQQRHSMFLHSYAFGTLKATSQASRNAIKAHSTESYDIPSEAEDLSSTFPRKRVFSEVTAGRSVQEKEKIRFRLPTGRSPGAMRRHASSSLLFSKSSSIDSATGKDIKLETQPGFLLYPDDYKDEDLSCSHAVSGMMKVRVIKATNLYFNDKKQTKKIYCAIEVDFERKAFTAAKKATKNPNWDEVFDIEIQHGREMTLMCCSSNKEFDKHVGRSSFYLTPLVRRGQIHQMIIRLKPEGLLYAELEFTELKTLLKRAPSGKQTGVFGFNISVTSETERSSIPHIVRKCVEEIEKRGIQSVGLYRISGNARRKEQLRTQFDEDSTHVDISTDNCPDVNVITGILKDYLRELPEPLITDKMSQDLILGVQDNIQEKSPDMQKKFLSKLLSELPNSNRNTLIYILNHLCRVINEEQNKMDCKSLSVCVAPVLQCSPKNLSESKDLLNLKMYLTTVEVLLDMWNRLEVRIN
ncbi:uncharacterized protein LOC116287036 [Actinia tenebrosa]|uniref:Uncharacterized protein LOC116287036 n=1 Tax=Actinia tenebrosa TaxID=6105 RepID=A0A6P8GZ65_ACTTE|nr:uncharacterized protein LOC116287036 [Actinia tenebrosa]